MAPKAKKATEAVEKVETDEIYNALMFLANEFDILFEVRFNSRTHVSSYPSPTHLYLPGAISSPIDATLGH